MFNLAYLIIGLILFFLGSAVGSFINVYIYRTITDQDWLGGRSECEKCRNKIAWYDLIPVFSYLWLRGKCRHCGKRIGLIHPIVEVIVGLLFVWWYFIGALFFRLTSLPFQAIQPAYWLLAGILLLIIFVADILYYFVPNSIVGLLLALTLIYRIGLTFFGLMQPKDLIMAILASIGLVFAFYLLHVGTKGKGFGMGDVKLAAPLALIMGWPKVLVGVFLAFFIGAVVGLGLIATGKRKFGQIVPFAPFLILGTLLALIFGQQIWQSYLSLL